AYGDVQSLQTVEAILLRIDQPDEQSPPERSTEAEPTENLLNWTDLAANADADVEPRRIMAYPMQHVTPEEAASLFNLLFPNVTTGDSTTEPHIAAVSQQKMLIVRGTEQQHEEIQNLIEIVDRAVESDGAADETETSEGTPAENMEPPIDSPDLTRSVRVFKLKAAE